MKKIQEIFFSHAASVLVAFYLISRLSFLTLLPVFNDESIYLDWGWREVHTPGLLFYSLLDGKQPFFMWLFGISESIISDQLFAGRVVSVLAGLAAMLGVYFLAKRYINKNTAILAATFYIVIPIFVTYDRLSLMESGVAACGIWSLYFLLRFIESPRQKYAASLGGILGIGFFIKSSALLFMVATLVLLIVHLRGRKEKAGIIPGICTAFLVFIVVILPLIIQPMYWQTIQMNSRYSLTFGELLHFPIGNVLQNLFGNTIIIAVFVTPILAILTLYGIAGSRDRKYIWFTALWLIVSVGIETIVARGTTQRYLVSFLPPFTILAAYGLVQLKKTMGKYYGAVAALSLLLPVFLSFIQIHDPVQYVKTTLPITKQTDSGFIYGQISGFGTSEIVKKIHDLSGGKPVAVATAINIGNPENAVATYFHTAKNITMIYLDKRLFGTAVNEYQCFVPEIPVYYVARDEQQSEMNEYFEEVYRYHHPYSDYSLGIYQFRDDCSGKSVRFNPTIFKR